MDASPLPDCGGLSRNLRWKEAESIPEFVEHAREKHKQERLLTFLNAFIDGSMETRYRERFTRNAYATLHTGFGASAACMLAQQSQKNKWNSIEACIYRERTAAYVT